MEVAIDAHLASGTVRGFWWGEKQGPLDSRIMAETINTLRIAAGHSGGAFVVESCPPSLKRSVDVWGPPGPDLAIMKRLKELFDPGRRLSPGRFLGGL